MRESLQESYVYAEILWGFAYPQVERLIEDNKICQKKPCRYSRRRLIRTTTNTSSVSKRWGGELQWPGSELALGSLRNKWHACTIPASPSSWQFDFMQLGHEWSPSGSPPGLNDSFRVHSVYRIVPGNLATCPNSRSWGCRIVQVTWLITGSCRTLSLDTKLPQR